MTFICDPCHERLSEPEFHWVESLGPCEICHIVGVNYHCKCPPTREQARREGVSEQCIREGNY